MKTVLITGSTRGIGRATAIEFAKNNYNIVINYIYNDNIAEELKNYIENTYNVKVLTIKTDISIEKDVINMVNTIIDKFNNIDVLVNNAGISMDNIIDNKTSEEFNKVLNINLTGTYLVTKYVSNNMLKNKKGKIINISSTNAIDTYYPYSIDYDASKAGIISLTHNFAKLLAPYINVNCIAPGWVNTDMNKNLNKEQIEQEKTKILLNRFANPEEISKVIYFLSTEESNYINNTVIRVDGGINY